ncbi:MAG: AbrB/MazE/SpoVT family DNA-binding domain-containing protein [Acidobacteria bacterium]|nr:AbrB/MazE/SpoVT family DNA-binding domain-containing protein [Acidobacteriota bacterium]
MQKRLTKYGNDFALVVDQPMLELLNIDAETPLEITTDGSRLIISKAAPDSRQKRLEAAQAMAHERYTNAFEKLAE